MLTAVDVRKNFKGLNALDGASIDVQAGQIVGLVGPNGSGKTTLLNVLSGFIRPDAGEIHIDDKKINRLPSWDVMRLGVGRTFQSPQLPARMTVLETMLCAAELPTGQSLVGAFLRRGKVEAEEQDAIERATAILDSLGIPGVGSQRATELSGGQQKLLSMGLVLMRSPRLLMLDEPTAGVNPSLRRSMVDILKRLMEEREIAMLIVEHDMEFVQRLCGRVFVLDKGKVVAECKPSELANDPRVVEAYLGKRKASQPASPIPPGAVAERR
jgi:branched-chain amino acid transport system ATP-binding protein